MKEKKGNNRPAVSFSGRSNIWPLHSQPHEEKDEKETERGGQKPTWNVTPWLQSLASVQTDKERDEGKRRQTNKGKRKELTRYILPW